MEKWNLGYLLGAVVLIGLILTALRNAYGIFKNKNKETEAQKTVQLEECKELKLSVSEKNIDYIGKNHPVIATLIFKIVPYILAAVVILYILYSNIEMSKINIDKFCQTAKEFGYTTTDSTESLRKSTSLDESIKEAVSINNDMMDIDFIVLDNSRNSKMLYQNISFTIETNEIAQTNETLVQEYYAENQSYYVAKIRIDNKFICVVAYKEYKEEVNEFLKELGCLDLQPPIVDRNVIMWFIFIFVGVLIIVVSYKISQDKKATSSISAEMYDNVDSNM